VRILGIDPGTRIVGYGLVNIEKGRQRAEDFGIFAVSGTVPFSHKLKQIHTWVSDLIKQFHPDGVAVEEVFVSQNAKTTLKLGHSRGVILLAAAEQNLPVHEYAPREIKQAVVGRGSASKEQVKWMISQMLNIRIDDLKEDAADALAAALCHGLRQSGAGQILSRSVR
jgi:crossover junction endodeoxyribonuclease RuvC